VLSLHDVRIGVNDDGRDFGGRFQCLYLPCQWYGKQPAT
jgi:hypothetical protein